MPESNLANTTLRRERYSRMSRSIAEQIVKHVSGKVLAATIEKAVDAQQVVATGHQRRLNSSAPAYLCVSRVRHQRVAKAPATDGILETTTFFDV